MMKNLLKRLALGAAVTTVAAAGVAVTPSVAEAASYNGVCGSGYGVIDTLPLAEGTIFLTYNRSNGYNCVVTVRNNPSSYLMQMEASIKKSGTTQWKQDLDFYTTYAGPVYLYAPGACIDWEGGINGEVNYQYHSHCG
ncbi:spore-associated protein A [Kitasatospora sp. NPDC059571]|uniref:spore-associated protein A n=1 Tax=Kitasatospora sp. NPDC059571 TaxID=3346871 RepID=UPI0036C0F88A